MSRFQVVTQIYMSLTTYRCCAVRAGKQAHGFAKHDEHKRCGTGCARRFVKVMGRLPGGSTAVGAAVLSYRYARCLPHAVGHLRQLRNSRKSQAHALPIPVNRQTIVRAVIWCHTVRSRRAPQLVVQETQQYSRKSCAFVHEYRDRHVQPATDISCFVPTTSEMHHPSL